MPSGNTMHGHTLPLTHTFTRTVPQRTDGMTRGTQNSTSSGCLSTPDLKNPGRKGRWTPAWGLIHRSTQTHVKNEVTSLHTSACIFARMWLLLAHSSAPAFSIVSPILLLVCITSEIARGRIGARLRSLVARFVPPLPPLMSTFSRRDSRDSLPGGRCFQRALRRCRASSQPAALHRLPPC